MRACFIPLTLPANYVDEIRSVMNSFGTRHAASRSWSDARRRACRPHISDQEVGFLLVDPMPRLRENPKDADLDYPLRACFKLGRSGSVKVNHQCSRRLPRRASMSGWPDESGTMPPRPRPSSLCSKGMQHMVLDNCNVDSSVQATHQW